MNWRMGSIGHGLFGEGQAVRCKVKWQPDQMFCRLSGDHYAFEGGFLATRASFFPKNLFVIFAKHSPLPLFGDNFPTKKTLNEPVWC